MSRNVAVVGVGRWGKNLARNFYEIGVLHTLCDMNESHLDEKLYPEISLKTNFRAVLENQEITRIVIAAPATQHFDLAKKALLAGKDVYIEKPFCMSVEEGEELLAIAKDRILMVGHLLQYHPCVIHLKEMVGSGAIGHLQYIVSNRLNLGSFRPDENALWNFAPHDLSVILSLCGDKLPDFVQTTGAACITGEIEDLAVMTMRFEGNIGAHIFVSWLNPFKEQKMTVIGSRGMIVFDDTLPWDDKLTYYPSYLQRTDSKVPVITSVTPEKIKVPYAEPLKEECKHFVECCDHRKTPRTDGHEAIRVLKVLQATTLVSS